MPLTKCVKDITEIKVSNGKSYVSSIFDDIDSADLGVSISANMQASLCVDMLDNAIMVYTYIKGAIVHSDRGEQYTNQTYRDAVIKHSIIQSMNSAGSVGGRCHDNACCESMWARKRYDLFYGHYDIKKFTKSELKVKYGDIS